MILVRSKRTPDMAKDLCRSPSQCLKMVLHICEQEREVTAVMIMGHHPTRDTPEPFVWIRYIITRFSTPHRILASKQIVKSEEAPEKIE